MCGISLSVEIIESKRIKAHPLNQSTTEFTFRGFPQMLKHNAIPPLQRTKGEFSFGVNFFQLLSVFHSQINIFV